MTSKTHPRSPSPPPSAAQPSLLKRLKSSHISEDPPSATPDPTPHFAADLFVPSNIHRLHTEYENSGPFKHAVVEKLFQDDLLKQVKDEALAELSFSEKETDIYKVYQTGDLASLSYLSEQQLALLPNLLTLRDALYSPMFRNFLRAVTGCGPLSGTKQDMSVVSYRKGCHLLNHDDVIGTRRVSYILYMPLPHYQGWQADWGGALELYPVKPGPDGVPEPEPVPEKSVPPVWNQFIFFEIQPGRSFHSVEEVVVGESEDGRQRLSISGWFHAAQPGEEGYAPEPEPELKSSREQLTSTQTDFKPYPENVDPPLPDEPLSEEHVSFLSEFLNPVYLQARTMKALASRFVEESSLELHSFLCAPLADKLRTGLVEKDDQDGLGPSRATRIPPHTAGSGGAWRIRGPPHKWRYGALRPLEGTGPKMAVSPRWAHADVDDVIRGLQDELYPSTAFRAWLACVSKLLPVRHAEEARRFRPGLDYTLATSEPSEARLDVVLGLTPQVETQGAEGAQNGHTNGHVSTEEVAPVGWQTGEWGGWECYMAPHDEEDDPAVYRSGSSKKKNEANGTNGHSASKEEGAMQGVEEDEEDDDDDGTLLTVQPGFNRLLLVLRDEGVMHFVKYVSAAAEGSRWDICGEFEIGMIQVESGDES
ncbi:Oxoglutarate and iron-dependent oxygenase degradation C-term-domain-containing protein [Dichomitus squalens]|uniref:Oxoglutarate and iron-dependent oxygenase degradation C-term-domain-containing protein n=1 Tax=Dichomitus squalens TaxID=114155 RepID=A0A4Q9P8Q2_9APHY|nr:Oxoglutarate and iron-dependent oxygenase degradation C-term-domain-containing protein [Dichomitus squalens]TBU64050.1 Oxoglutarate and iron-dependent oxygenase degradation C-term-domain-containing protein [Dichomitus squalens]